MSRGIGKLQADILRFMDDGKLHDAVEIACGIAGASECSTSEAVSVRRALRSLAVRGAVVDLGHGFHNGRKRWATPAAAESYRGRVATVFGSRQSLSTSEPSP